MQNMPLVNITPRYISNPFKYLRETHSVDIIKKVEDLESFSKKICCLRQRLRFLHRCKKNCLIPKSLKVKSLVRSQEGRRIAMNTERRFLSAGISKLHSEIRLKEEQIKTIKDFLSSKLLEAHFKVILVYLGKKSAIVTERIKTNLIKKFGILLENKKITVADMSSKWVQNLSDKELNPNELSLLSKGMKFAVSFRRTDAAEFIAPIEKAISDLPEKESSAIRLSLTTHLYSKTAIPDNLTRGEKNALSRLKRDSSIVILPADKGKSTVILNTSDYNNKLDDLLLDEKTYERINKDPTLTVQNKMNKLLLDFQKKGFFTNQEYKRLHCTNGTISKFYGLPKIHKEGVPLRPIVSFLTSPCYNLSKYLSDILYEYSVNQYSIKTSEEFSNKIRSEKLEEGEICVSFDVVALFTSVPTEMACKAALEAMKKDNEFGNKHNLPPEETIELLNLCLKSTSFINRGILYKQKYGTAMGSPVSPTVANLVMDTIEKEALTTFMGAPRFWVRYVDDTFAIIHEKKADEFLIHLNSINNNIKFTMEKEENKKIAFLDVLIEHDDAGNFATSVYRKSICTDRLLDYHSNHPLNHKTSAINTLFRRAERISSNEYLLKKEKDYLVDIFKKNNYPNWMISSHSAKNRQNSNKVEKDKTDKYVCLPFIKGVSEPIKRMLKKNNIYCAFKPSNTLRSLISHPKDFTPRYDQSNVIYSIPCGTCDKCYVGQTKRCLRKRMEEHQDNIKKKRD